MRGLISGFGRSFSGTLSSIATALEYLTFIDMKYRLVILILTFGVAFAAPKLRRVNDVDYVGDANPRQTLDLYIPETKT